MNERAARKPKISVVVPFLNSERYFKRAIESVFAQTFKDWELLLVDDGSRDASREIALDFARRHPGRIRVLRHPGGRRLGAFRSRVVGAMQAKASKIALLDSDDEWQPELLESREADYRCAFGDRPGIACGPVIFFWERRRGVPRMALQPAPAAGLYPPPELFSIYLEDSYVKSPTPSGALLHRQILLESERNDPGIEQPIEDLNLWFYALLRYPFVIGSRPLVWYRQHHKSAMGRVLARGRFAAMREKHLQWLLSHLAATGIERHRRLSRLVHKALAQ